MTNPLHHIELWTSDLEASGPSIDWLLVRLGWEANVDPLWPQGRTWDHPSGVYLVLEQSGDVSGPHERTRAGLNHLALRVTSRDELDALRADGPSHGWTELFAGRYPHAGGPQHTALFLANDEGFEVELVVE